MNAGYIKLHRKMLDWRWFRHPDTFRMFVYLLLVANHKDGRDGFANIHRGQTMTSIPKLSEMLGISAQSVRTSLARLKSTGEITDQSTNKYRLITVLNYDKYQGLEEEVAADESTGWPTGRSQAANRQLTANKNEKNEKNEKNTEGVSSRFVPPTEAEVGAYCLERGNGIEPRAFVDFYASKGWLVGKAKMRDWKAAVRTWEQRHPKPTPAVPPKPKAPEPPRPWQEPKRERTAQEQAEYEAKMEVLRRSLATIGH